MITNNNLMRAALNYTPFINCDERALLRRKLFLKSQAIKLIRGERKELRERLFLLNLKRSLESRIGNDFDQELSARIDAVTCLLEAQK